MTVSTFHDLGVDPVLADALARHDILEPFPIQRLTIPLALDGADVIGQARTGTGKTLAFGLPVLHRTEHGADGVQALVVTPTRELALQVAGDLQQAGEAVGVRVMAVYGGVALEPQELALRADRVDVLVGTPGRLLDHVRRRNLDLTTVRILVLDEADEMLDMGFLPDVEQLIAGCSQRRQMLLFSATMPREVVTIARRYMTKPTFLRAESDEPQIAPTTEQHFLLVHRLDKPRVLARILQAPDAKLAAAFVRTRRMADRLVTELRELGVSATPIHGDLRQARREHNLARFREGEADVLVATEVAARGLDIVGVTHVVNYDCPSDEKMYLHRIGRTGRAGAPGVAVTFATSDEVERINVIRKAVGATDVPVEEVFSTSPLLRARFDLPAHTPWDRFASASSGEEDASGGEPVRRSRRRRPRRGEGEASGPDRDGDVGGQRQEQDGTPGADPTAPDHAPTNGEPTAPDHAPTNAEPTAPDHATASAEPTAPDHATAGAGGRPERVRTRSRTGSRRQRTHRRSDDAAQRRGAGERSRRAGRGRDATPSGERRDRRADDDEQPTRPERRAAGGEGGSDRAGRPAPTSPGKPARGEGHPLLERRVKVDYLP
ncbi:MAG TPA: DEAD/DEAH box helicase [Nitriliruptorales bacterium]|nr:DEAD/DEAH box helicase [Nitriliruptorales bacterium]